MRQSPASILLASCIIMMGALHLHWTIKCCMLLAIHMHTLSKDFFLKNEQACSLVCTHSEPFQPP